MQDNMLGDWAEQTPFIVLKHINMSMFKNDYDDSNFIFNFITLPKQQTLDFLEEAEKTELSFHKEISTHRRSSLKAVLSLKLDD